MTNQQVQPTQSLQKDAPNFNADVEVSESDSATKAENTPQNNALQDQRVDEMNRQQEFAHNQEVQQRQQAERQQAERQQAERQQAERQQAERQDAAERAIWERVERNEAQRRESEAAAVRQLDEKRRNREMDASQRFIERQESEKRDIARSGGGDSFDRFRMNTRDNRIENERQRMSENQ